MLLRILLFSGTATAELPTNKLTPLTRTDGRPLLLTHKYSGKNGGYK